SILVRVFVSNQQNGNDGARTEMLCPRSQGGLHYNCTTVQNVRHSKKDWVINPPEKTRLLQKATTTLKNAAKS
ncbi:hypothetical protein, partial [Escherichia coli]|uniref:hypothetical protein n=1 Tax=Escherichia coli TaxID=562 RepID=UPI001BC8A106